MPEEKILTKEIAEQFLKDEDSVDLEEFTSIEDDAAETLGEGSASLTANGLFQERPRLSLDGLTSLSDAAAESLATTCAGETLSLDGLT